MLLTKYLLPILKEQPQDAQIVSHSLMLRAGMIKQQTAGIYSWLPLGLKVLKNIENIVRFNMNAAGSVEILMPCTQPADLWIESGRYEDYGQEMLRIKDRHDNNLLFGPTNEEVVTDIFRSSIQSYKYLPLNLYHIQWKFRDEIRPRFGVMRAREFLMKDAYTFDIDKESAIKTYNNMYIAYMRTFRALGLMAIPMIADNGPIGGDLSHEFHVIAKTGESTIYYDKKFTSLNVQQLDDINTLQSLYAATDEKHDITKCHVLEQDLLISKGIEVGHIFYIGTKYAKAMNTYIHNSKSKLLPVEMSSYGIGISRLVAAIIESNYDDKGIIWPMSVAPFKVSMINLHMSDSLCNSVAEKVYNALNAVGIDVLYDDTNSRPGSKFAIHDLIGSPWQVIISAKKVLSGLIEIKTRKTLSSEDMNIDVAIDKLINDLKC